MIQFLFQCSPIVSQTASFNWAAVIPSIGSILVSLAVIYYNSKTTKRSIEANNANIDKTLRNTKETSDRTLQTTKETSDKTLASKRIEERKAEIYKTLNELYGPFSQLRQKSDLLYQKFRVEKPDNTGEGRFSTLLYLLANNGPDNLSENDRILLTEMIKIGGLCEELIQNKAGLIDNEELRRKWFPLAAKHYLIIRLAYNRSLKGEVALYKDSMFPIQIDALIEERISTLQQELKSLK